MSASQTVACEPPAPVSFLARGRNRLVRPPLLYALHSGNLYGTERMALASAQCLTKRFRPTVLAPHGPVLGEAACMGFGIEPFAGSANFVRALRPHLAQHRRLAFVATGVSHSLACLALNSVYRRQIAHLHVVHGGADERDSYGRKRYLNHAPVWIVAVSEFVRERLIAHGVNPDRIRVIENFLPEERIEELGQRPRFDRAGIRRVLVISRLDPIKRVDLLFDALDREPRLRHLSVRVLGSGWEEDNLRERAARTHPNVRFLGFQGDVASELAEADLLLHLCPAEPFGLAVLEAMAAGVPVLVPDSGGAGSLVDPGLSGFRFRADDAAALARRLLELDAMPAGAMNEIVAGGRASLRTRFSASARAAEYTRLLEDAPV